jgi:hypothetical protein
VTLRDEQWQTLDPLIPRHAEPAPFSGNYGVPLLGLADIHVCMIVRLTELLSKVPEKLVANAPLILRQGNVITCPALLRARSMSSWYDFHVFPACDRRVLRCSGVFWLVPPVQGE